MIAKIDFARALYCRRCHGSLAVTDPGERGMCEHCVEIVPPTDVRWPRGWAFVVMLVAGAALWAVVIYGIVTIVRSTP